MKTNRIIACFAACAAISSIAFAADTEKARTEKRVTVMSAGPGERADKPREPVTYLGVEVAPASGALSAQLKLPEGQGLVINFVVPDGPAAKAGLQRHDVLTRLDDQILIDPRQLSVLVRAHKEGDKVNVTYVRAGAETRAAVTLEKHTPPEAAMGWTRTFSPATFETRVFDGDDDGGADVFREFRVEHSTGGSAGMRVPMHSAGAMSVPGAPVVTIFQPQANVIFADDGGTLEVRMDGARRMLTAKDAKGGVIFEGPVNGPEQRAALPEEVRKRLEKLESMGALDNIRMPHPLPTPQPAAAPQAPGGGVSDVLFQRTPPSTVTIGHSARSMVL